MRITLILLFTILIVGCGNININDTYTEANVAWFFQQDNTKMANAIFNEDINKIRQLIRKEGYDVNTRDKVENGVWTYYWTYLNYAVVKDKLNSAKALINLGADVNELLIISGSGSSNLNLAAQNGGRKMFELLLDRNITIDHTITESPFYNLLINNHFDKALFDLLIAHGADVNHPKYVSGTTPLMTAYDINNHQAIDYLLVHGADPLEISTSGHSFASSIQMDLNDGINTETAKKYKQRLIDEYGIQYPVEVSYRKGLEQAIKRYENTTAKEKEIVGESEVERIEKIRKSLITGYRNHIPID